MKLVNELNQIELEVLTARAKYGPFHSTHEVYAVLKEELEEFWELVRKKPDQNKSHSMISELNQVAAIAIRAAKELEEKKIKWV